MSVVPKRRWLEKFTNVAGTVEVTFSRLEHEWTPSQALEVPVAVAAGADYGVNLLGTGPMPKRVASERVRYLIRHSEGNTIDAQVDQHRARLRQIGQGRLWTLDDEGNRRWAKAQIVAMPDFNFGPQNREFVPVSIEFARFSDWHAETETVVSQHVTASPTVMQVVNAGTARVTSLSIVIDARAGGGFVNPRVENSQTSEWLQVERSAANGNHVIRIDAARFAVEYSTDGGTAWANDYENLVTGPAQAGLITLVPGANDIAISGVTNADVEVRFFAPFE